MKNTPSNKKKNKIARWLKLILTTFILFTGVSFIKHSDWRMGVQLQMEINTPTRDVFFLHIPGHKRPLKGRIQKTGTSTLHISLPRKIEKLTLVPGTKPTNITFIRLTLKTMMKSETLKGSELQEFFFYKNNITNEKTENEQYSFTTTGRDCWTAPNNSFYQRLDSLQSDKTPFYILLILIDAIFFYFLYHFNLTGLWKQMKSIRAYQVPLILIFLSLIFSQFISWFVLGPQPPDSAEKRPITKAPEFIWDEISNLPPIYQAYYNDHFPFRYQLVFLHNLLKFKILNVSAIDKVVLGKDGWLFLENQNPRPGTVEYFRGIKPFTQPELEQWRQLLEQRYKFLKAQGIHYLFVIAPNKNTIYPELMPDSIRKVNNHSRWDQLLKYMTQHTDVPLIDLRPALLKAKNHHRVYSLTDTHWNDYGAYIAYQQIMTRLSPLLKKAKPLPLSRFQIQHLDHSGGDMALMLLLHEKILRENYIILQATPPLTWTLRKPKPIKGIKKLKATRCPSAPLPRLLMVHDSFYKNLVPFFSESFRQVTYIWDWGLNFYPEVIQHDKPTVVIDEMAERFLMAPPPVNPPQLMQYK